MTLLWLFFFKPYISTALDGVPPSRLAARLRLMGFSQTALLWVRSYPTGRGRRVVSKINWFFPWLGANFGVPHGSALGLLLFWLYIVTTFVINLTIAVSTIFWSLCSDTTWRLGWWNSFDWENCWNCIEVGHSSIPTAMKTKAIICVSPGDVYEINPSNSLRSHIDEVTNKFNCTFYSFLQTVRLWSFSKAVRDVTPLSLSWLLFSSLARMLRLMNNNIDCKCYKTC